MTFDVADLRAHLLGRWRVERTLLDRSTGARGTFTGVVVFEHDSGGLRQREEGTMVWPTHRGPATREYGWRNTADAAVMDAFFPDGRAFHSLDLSRGCWTAEHWCSPDTYLVRFTAISADRLDYEWDVQGPGKDLLLHTSLFRAA
ncbi:MAG TPA: DUF6314 family protein [Micrococcaceae bacterium]